MKARACLCALLLMGLLAACDTPGSGGSTSDATFVLFDVSASTNASALRDGYRRDFQDILESIDVKRGAVVGVDIIDDNPLAHSEIASVEFAAYDPLRDNQATYEARTDDHRRQLVAEAERRLSRSRRGTDVLGAFSVAGRFFASYPSAGAKRLVVFSDMMNSTPGFRFGAMRWSQATIDELIRDQRRDGALPDLTGVYVCVVGAGAQASRDASSETIRWVQHFWLEYFGAASARLDPSRYGASLLECN